MELADVVDSKSTGGDTVPVRVRPPAPKKRVPHRGTLFFRSVGLSRLSIGLNLLLRSKLTLPRRIANANRNAIFPRHGRRFESFRLCVTKTARRAPSVFLPAAKIHLPPGGRLCAPATRIAKRGSRMPPQSLHRRTAVPLPLHKGGTLLRS